jgi:NTE family protein
MIKNIIFSGGGLKGWAYIGSIQALSEYISREHIEQVIGVSIGSVFGLFYLLDIKWDFLLDYFIDLNFKEMLDINLDNLIINQSLLEGKKFKETIKNVITLNNFDPEMTFKEIKKQTNITFTVNATNIDHGHLQYFNETLTPGVKVIDAIMASSSLPFLFPPTCINGVYYYDGGFCNNSPTDITEEVFTIAFDVNFEKSVLRTNFKLFDLMMCLSKICNKNKTQSSTYKILDVKFKDHFMNLNQSRDDIFNIYMNGYTNSKRILFDNYKALK